MKTPTDEELNLAMCEWMGWKNIITIKEGSELCCPANPAGFKRGISFVNFQRGVDASKPYNYSPIPNYLSDGSPRRLLNEAEARLTPMQWHQYLHELAKVVREQRQTVIQTRQYVSANARQRVIAILRTVKPELFQ